jgi:hypothetical protein
MAGFLALEVKADARLARRDARVIFAHRRPDGHFFPGRLFGGSCYNGATCQ